MACEHSYAFQGVVYSDSGNVPGSGAQYRYYEDKYYCTKCLDIRYGGARVLGNSYGAPINGAFPK